MLPFAPCRSADLPWCRCRQPPLSPARRRWGCSRSCPPLSRPSTSAGQPRRGTRPVPSPPLRSRPGRSPRGAAAPGPAVPAEQRGAPPARTRGPLSGRAARSPAAHGDAAAPPAARAGSESTGASASPAAGTEHARPAGAAAAPRPEPPPAAPRACRSPMATCRLHAWPTACSPGSGHSRHIGKDGRASKIADYYAAFSELQDS